MFLPLCGSMWVLPSYSQVWVLPFKDTLVVCKMSPLFLTSYLLAPFSKYSLLLNENEARNRKYAPLLHNGRCELQCYT